MSENKAASKSPLLGVLICAGLFLYGVFYAIRRSLFLELSMPTIAALIFVGILAILVLLVWVLGTLNVCCAKTSSESCRQAFKPIFVVQPTKYKFLPDAQGGANLVPFSFIHHR